MCAASTESAVLCIANGSQNSAVWRHIDNGVDLQNTFRTNLGDDEGGTERSGGRVFNHKDSYSDDDVEIILRADGKRISPTVQNNR
jgi:hypothetical protein